MNIRLRRATAAIMAAVTLAACTSAGDGIDAAALGDWLDAYGVAWETKDPAAAAGLFSADALYHESPYAEPFEGPEAIADYWATVTEDQADIDFSYELIAVSGYSGVAEWSARFRSISGDVPVELDGVFVLEFNEDGVVDSLREWWHVR